MTCETISCEFNPRNSEVYFIDSADGKEKIYPGIECVHEFTELKGCSVHSSFIEPLEILEKEFQGGVVKYKEMVEGSENGIAYTLAAKALTICLQRIEKLKNQEE